MLLRMYPVIEDGNKQLKGRFTQLGRDFDEMTRDRLGVTGQEFLERWRGRDYQVRKREAWEKPIVGLMDGIYRLPDWACWVIVAVVGSFLLFLIAACILTAVIQ